jgi:hypothetical protein
MYTIKVEPDSEDETHCSDVDIAKADTKRTFVEVKCEIERNTDTIKVKPNSEDEVHRSHDAQKVDTEPDHSQDFTVVGVKCEIEVGQFWKLVFFLVFVFSQYTAGNLMNCKESYLNVSISHGGLNFPGLA